MQKSAEEKGGWADSGNSRVTGRKVAPLRETRTPKVGTGGGRRS